MQQVLSLDFTNRQWKSLFLIPLLLMASMAVVPFETGCVSSKTASQIFNAAATSVGSVLKITNPTWTGLAQYNQLVATATPLIAAGLTGTNGQKALQAVSDIVALVNTIPQIPPEYQALIAIGLAGFQSVMALIQAQQTGTGKVSVTIPSYTSAKQYQKDWNAEIAKHPELSVAKLKL